MAEMARHGSYYILDGAQLAIGHATIANEKTSVLGLGQGWYCQYGFVHMFSNWPE